MHVTGTVYTGMSATSVCTYRQVRGNQKFYREKYFLYDLDT